MPFAEHRQRIRQRRKRNRAHRPRRIGRLPDPAARRPHIQRVARRIRRIDRQRRHPPGHRAKALARHLHRPNSRPRRAQIAAPRRHRRPRSLTRHHRLMLTPRRIQLPRARNSTPAKKMPRPHLMRRRRILRLRKRRTQQSSPASSCGATYSAALVRSVVRMASRWRRILRHTAQNSLSAKHPRNLRTNRQPSKSAVTLRWWLAGFSSAQSSPNLSRRQSTVSRSSNLSPASPPPRSSRSHTRYGPSESSRNRTPPPDPAA